MKKKLLSLLLALAMVTSLTIPALAADGLLISPNPLTGLPVAEEGSIVVLYTNDVHTYMDNGSHEEPGLRYSDVAALKEYYEAAGAHVLLLDAGDHIQGTAYGSMDKGKTIIDLMNAVGYDAATLGNHEFDYDMDGCMDVIDWAEFPYLSCNFYHEKDGVAGEQILDSYKVFDLGGVKVAVVGITTPESFSKTTPAYFQDDEGNYIYGIAGGEDGALLYAAVQKAVDAASAQADFVIALGHLGVETASGPWTSEAVIANTSGIDVFIDGHSHTVLPRKEISDKNGDPVVLTQTGEYLGSVGVLTIGKPAVGTWLLSAANLAAMGVKRDEKVESMENAWITELDARLGKVIGSFANTLDNYDADGNRLVRSQETNSGDFSADALYYLFDSMELDVDFAVMNGGGVRNKALTGDITYLTCKEIHTFGNVACLITVTGQQMLDALEWSYRNVGRGEDGSFLHVAGLKFTINTAIPSTVSADERDVWISGPTGAYRVTDVQVLNNQTGEYEPLDLAASYNLAGYNYTLRDLGGGFAMLTGAPNVLDYVMEDYMVLANYVQSFENGVVTGYENVYGDGRITIVHEEPETTTYVVMPGDSLWAIAARVYGSGAKWNLLYEANSAIKDPNMIYVGQTLVIP